MAKKRPVRLGEVCGRMDRPCPTCQRPLPEDSEAHRPFCSERCRMLDLSKWLDGDYAIPGAPVDPYPETDPDNG